MYLHNYSLVLIKEEEPIFKAFLNGMEAEFNTCAFATFTLFELRNISDNGKYKIDRFVEKNFPECRNRTWELIEKF